MADLFLIINEAGVIECVSAPTVEAFGYTAAQLNGKSVRLILEIPSADEPLLAWLHASVNPILHGIHRDGRRFPLRLTQNEIHGDGQTHYVLLLQAPGETPVADDPFLQHKELYELATRQGRISVWEVDYRTNHLQFSPVLAGILGLSGDAIPTTLDGWAKYFHPDDWPILQRESERMLRREIPELNLECRMIHADGRVLWTLVRGEASFDAQGRPIQALGTSIDITQRKLAEQRAALEHAVTRVLAASPNLADASTPILRAICEALDWDVGVLWQANTEAQMLTCVQTWSRFPAVVEEFESVTRKFKFTPGVGLAGRVWSSRQPAWVVDVVQDTNFPRVKYAAKVGLHSALAFPILLEKSVHGVLEFFSQEIEQPDQELLQMMTVIGSQISQFIERKKAEEERDLFFTLSLDLLCIADMRGFRRVNPSFCKTLGYSEAELTSRPFLDFVHPDDLPATENAVAELQQGKDVIRFENRYRCKDGSYRWLSWQCPAPAAGSKLLYAVARDVTQAKRVQADLEHAKQEAERANRAKSEFLSRMSHELRTPLNAILGFGQLLQREPLSARQRQQIDLIVNGGRHLLNLINEVLDITRIEVGRLDLSPEAVDLASLLGEVVNLTQPMAEQRGITVTIDETSVRERSVLADKQRLKQVLLNLVSNAIKYNVERGKVALHCKATPQQRLQIQVQDFGPGIAPEKQTRLFTPFDRLGAEVTPIEGSGLGLVLSKRLVEIMGGTLTFVSQPGQGTSFIVELAQERSVKAILAELPTPAALPAGTDSPYTLLYIEDNAANIQLIEAVLAQRPGIRLVTAMEGQLGLQVARQIRPDLILLDVHLPDMKGSALMTTIRADADLREVPVVVISADATKYQIDRLYDAGASDYLTKPIDVDHFLSVLDCYLK
jgi:PAS domain S-box-containing protein